MFIIFCPECGGQIQKPKAVFEDAHHQAYFHAMVSGHGSVVVVNKND